MIGIFTFFLMLRWSMLVGWYELIRDPRSIRFNKRYSGQKFIAAKKRLSGRPTKSEESEGKPEKFRYFETPETLEQHPTFVLPDPEESPRWLSVPEAGDVSKRHETTNLFEEDEEDEDEEMVTRKKGKAKKVLGDDESDLV